MKKIFLFITIVTILVFQENVSYGSSKIERISGTNRYKTSVEISKYNYEKNEYVVLVTGENYPDAVSAGGLASYLNSPLLLTESKYLNEDTYTEIKRLNPKKIYIIGGENAISSSIFNKLNKEYEVSRISGKDRYYTSYEVKEEMIKLGASNNIGITNGNNFPDAISAGGIIAEKELALLLTDGYKEELTENSNIQYIFGGLNVGNISGKRLMGTNRYKTSLEIAKEKGNEVTTVILASGESYPDALSAISLSKKYNAPILLTARNSIDKEVKEYVKKAGQIIVVGGTGSISDTVIDEIKGINIPEEFYIWDKINNYSREIIMTEEEIKDFNRKNIQQNNDMNDVLNINKTYSKNEIISMINDLSKVPNNSYGKNNNKHSQKTKNNWKNNLNLENVRDQKELAFGIVTERTLLRTFPTWDENRTSGGSHDFFTETALNPWDPVLILHYSKDGNWIFGITENYKGWIFKDYIGIEDKENIRNYKNLEKEVVIDKQIQIKDKYFDMGTAIPISNNNVLIPNVAKNGNLEVYENNIPEVGTNRGYIAYTTANIVKQALKFKGEVYGWGGSNNAHDCSSFVQDVYKSFGIKMSRNTRDQENMKYTKRTNLSGLSRKNKIEKVKSLPVGTALYMKGHVTLYLGKDSKGNEKIIHQYDSHYENGRFISVKSCQITDILLGSSSGVTYLDKFNTAVEFVKP
ncbi:cell wall-binding repeat-containing protein [Miniphocaeibacter halophilus]|uniref:SH3 domain-containing protein n=1 Tax=Miniphocaeibacter halophilus TaxID=2931922 RepID=A0AC61MRI8_9FIRM|nr:cell wall-binding repeat-containing protein [Miniphocaeibacter halophilus]QQK08172.1 SH3 domain-containing protein [Miniphocaeibacter halophilus]